MDHKDCPFRETIAVFNERLERIDEEVRELHENMRYLLERIEKLNIAIAEERARLQARGDTLARLIAVASLLATAGNAVLMLISKL